MEKRALRVDPHEHAVNFYGSDKQLFATVADFLAPGLVADEPALILATAQHSAGILEQLAAHAVDVERALQAGHLLVRDADELLATVMRDGMPDVSAFEQHIASIIVGICRNRPNATIRAYGELVDLLWQDRKSQAAIRLEILWNQLITKHGFALLCGYTMGSFFKHGVEFQSVCEQHTKVSVSDNPMISIIETKSVPRTA